MKKTILILCFLVLILPLVTITSLSAENQGFTVASCSLPSQFSWRDINGTDYTTPVKNQAPAPTCESYGLCASLETLMQYTLGEVYTPDLSETHLYFYAGGTYERGYVNIMDAANYLIEHGVPDEGCYPDPHRAFDYPYESLPGWENRTTKITEWGWVEHDQESIKTALIEHGPLAICVHFMKDFLYYRGGVYRHRWGGSAGGHVMCMVGYDDTEQCWIVKNSAGTTWGEDGWVRIAYDEDMFADWYGPGTGIMYIDGVHGNLKPDVPKVHIETPDFFHTYVRGRAFSTLFRSLPIQKAAARIIGDLTVQVTAENTNSVEFYLDSLIQYTDDEAPFTWELHASRGLHTLEVRATNGSNISLDLRDIYVLT
ncbi:MAG: hypothetical protein BV456_13175 [Thermoplasmata archaeon M8B2D]|nr:MAG: hypothetical protein BV456_13175 [Thermoplasmata archaeon M8B2D]